MIVRLGYARAYRDRYHTVAESAFKDRLTNINAAGVEQLKLLPGYPMLREALIRLGLTVYVAVTVGGVLYLGTVALLAAPL